MFEVDLVGRELRKEGVRIRLQDQPFRVLAALLEKPGEVVTRAELQDRLWGGDTFVDFDKSLSAAVNKVRQALDDSRTHPHFIETLPKVGYRFIGQIRQEPDSPLDSPIATKQPHGSAMSWGRRRFGWIVAAVLSGLTLWAFSVFRAEPDSPSPADVLAPVPVTSYPGAEVHPSFSPDGSQLAFAWNREQGEQFDIYVQLTRPGRPVQLTSGPEDDLSPVWSPDGHWIAYVRVPHSGTYSYGRSSSAGVFVIPALGGAERKLGEIRVARPDHGPYLCWSPDGNALIAPDWPSETEPFGLFAIDLATGEKRRLTDSPYWDASPAVSPDGHTLAFVRVGDGAPASVHTLPISERLDPAGDVRRVTFDERWVSSLAWTPDGEEIVFSAGPMVGRRTLWRTSASGQAEAEPVNLPTQDVFAPALAREGRGLAYVEESWDYNIWALSLSPDGELLDSPKALIASTRFEKQPQYSPDGDRIVFGSNRSGHDEIWVCDSDGSDPVQLTSFQGPATGSPRWSPDGERIAFDVFRSEAGEIHVISADGGASTQLTNDSYVNMAPSWSQDGEWIYFASDRHDSRQIWKVSSNGASPSAKPVQVTQNGGRFAPFESKDGEFVYYLRGSDLWRVPRDGGEAVRVLEGIKGGGGYALTDEGVYYLTRAPEAGITDLKFFPFDGGDARLIHSFEQVVNHLAVSPDGRRILYLQQDQTSADLMLVESFH